MLEGPVAGDGGPGAGGEVVSAGAGVVVREAAGAVVDVFAAGRRRDTVGSGAAVTEGDVVARRGWRAVVAGAGRAPGWAAAAVVTPAPTTATTVTAVRPRVAAN